MFNGSKIYTKVLCRISLWTCIDTHVPNLVLIGPVVSEENIFEKFLAGHGAYLCKSWKIRLLHYINHYANGTITE